MKHPETLCAEITAALTTDSFGFSYGTKPDQNFDADEFTYPMVFLDKPIISTVKNTLSGVRIHRITLGLFFAYLADIDDTEATKFTECKVKAWNAAREFVLRLRKEDDYVTDVVEERLTDVDHIFDVNLCGCVAEITVDMPDAGSICVT